MIISEQKIDMTVPVMMTHSEKVISTRFHVSIQNISTSFQGVEMCFYMTESTQSNAPAPTGEGVYLSQKKNMTVYATSVGGYPDHATEAAKFRDVLERGRASQVILYLFL